MRRLLSAFLLCAFTGILVVGCSDSKSTPTSSSGPPPKVITSGKKNLVVERVD